MKNIFKLTLVLLLVAGISTGCDDFLEPSVDQNLPTETVIQSVDDLRSFVLGAHDDLNRVELYGRDFYVSADVMADNGFSNNNSGRFIPQTQFNFTVNSGYANGVWDVFYEAISSANVVINNESVETSAEVEYIKGQAYAIRAYAHMNLLLAFGQQFVSGGNPDFGVPYVSTYNEGDLYPARDPIATVWSNITDDLTQAANLMDPALDDGNPVYMNYAAVKGLQSRVYLYTGDFGAAIDAADAALGSYTPADDDLADWATGSGPNSLFELAFTATDRLGTDNIARILRDTNYGDVEATQNLYDSYDGADARLGLFSVVADTIRMNGKYVDELGTDNVRILRLAEVWLNKAEALARRGNAADLVEAVTMIQNMSTARGSGTTYVAATQPDVIDAVLAERRLELAFEGHRLYDLLRHGKDIPYVPSKAVNFITGGDITYGSGRLALPIPQAEMDANSNMEQNPYYE
jgi:tetratricopeptide (TPR) repeat protein